MKNDLISFGGLWKNTSKSGKTYLSGYFGDAKLMIFPNKSDNEKAPDYKVYIAKGKRQVEYEEGKKENPQPKSNNDDLPF